MHVLPGHDRLLGLQPRAAALQAQILAADHRVAAGGKHRAGHHAQRTVVRVAQRARRIAGARLALNVQRAAVALQGGAGDGDAVHGHAVVRRQVAVGGNRLAQDAPHGVGERAPLGGQNRGAVAQEGIDFSNGKHGGEYGFSVLPRSHAGQ